MKYHVNENCIGCGMCAGLCPEIFEMSEEGLAVAKDTDTDAKEAKEAKEGCPAGAIES